MTVDEQVEVDVFFFLWMVTSSLYGLCDGVNLLSSVSFDCMFALVVTMLVCLLTKSFGVQVAINNQVRLVVRT